MTKSTGYWVVYEVRDLQFVHVSKRFKTKREAEKERERIGQGLRRTKRNALGVGFVR